MIYKLTFSCEEGDQNFRRVFEADPDATFLDLHNAILQSVGYADDQMTSFFMCNEDWEKGQEVSRATDGAFDMTVAPLVDLWGFGLKNKSVVTDAEVDSLRQFVGYEQIVLEDGTMRKSYAEMRIDAGAIATRARHMFNNQKQ